MKAKRCVPYPYGWERNSAACNVDLSENIGKPGRLVDHRSVVGSHEQCASPFGVQDMAGNVEEWVQADGRGMGSKMGWKEVLKGSWWIPSRHACRQFQVGHNDVYSGAETGTRCCKDAPAARSRRALTPRCSLCASERARLQGSDDRLEERDSSWLIAPIHSPPEA